MQFGWYREYSRPDLLGRDFFINEEFRMMNAELVRGDTMSNVIEYKSFRFAVRIVNLYKYLTRSKKEFVLSKQLLRSGTSIGANIAEAQKCHTRADFNSKMIIALKEANETDYWLRLLHETEYISDKEYKSINSDINEIISILTSICKKTNKK